MQLFLTSQAFKVIPDIIKHLPQSGKVAFITTSSEGVEGDKWWMDADRKSFTDAGFEVTDYTVTDKTGAEIEKDLSDYDIYFLEGGNTFYLLDKMRASGFDTFITKQVKNGKVYIGSSAGSIVTGPNVGMMKRADSTRQASTLSSYEGLGLVNFVTMPHWGNNHFRDVYLDTRMELAYAEPYPYIILHDNQYIHVADDSLQIIEV